MKLNKSLHLLPLASAFVVPGALGLEIAGVDLSPAVNLAGVFTLAVAAALGALAFADYTGGRRVRPVSAALLADAKSPHPLAA